MTATRHDHQTIVKVHGAIERYLAENGNAAPVNAATDIIGALQNEGILFLERVERPAGRIAEHVEVVPVEDGREPGLHINGEHFGFAVAPDISVSYTDNHPAHRVTIEVFADRVTLPDWSKR